MYPLEDTIQPAMALKWKFLNNVLQKKLNFSSSLLAGMDTLASSWPPPPTGGPRILAALVSETERSSLWGLTSHFFCSSLAPSFPDSTGTW